MAKSKHSFSVKAVALGYICLILLGNIWLAFAIVAHPVPQWFQPAAEYCVGLTILAMVVALVARLRRPQSSRAIDGKADAKI